MDINFWNPGTDREDDAQDGMEAKQVWKIVKSIDAAGAVNKDDAEFMRMASWVWPCGSQSSVSFIFRSITCIPLFS
jgi:hypothetical protein